MVETERERERKIGTERERMRELDGESEMRLLLLLGVLHAYKLCYVGAPCRFISHELTHLSLYIILSMYDICNNILRFARRWAIVDCRLESDYGERRLLSLYIYI